MSEPPVEYADASRGGEAARSLAASWGISLRRAGELLAEPGEYRAELRSRRRLTTAEALRQLAARLPRHGPAS